MEILDIHESINLKEAVLLLLPNNTKFLEKIVQTFGGLSSIPDQILESILNNQKLFLDVRNEVNFSIDLESIKHEKNIIYIQTLKLWAIPKNDNSLFQNDILVYEIIMNDDNIVLLCENINDVLPKITKIIKKHYGIRPRYEKQDVNMPNHDSQFVKIILPNVLDQVINHR